MRLHLVLLACLTLYIVIRGHPQFLVSSVTNIIWSFLMISRIFFGHSHYDLSLTPSPLSLTFFSCGYPFWHQH